MAGKSKPMAMTISTFIDVAASLPPHLSVLVRGRHGIGKSEAVFQIGKMLDLPVIDRRLSQMTEGDMIGLPLLDGKTTRFCPPDWFMEAVDKPAILFLDEINRATMEVNQAAFQLVLSHELNGVKLHPGTRVFAAINDSHEYQVNEMDPAMHDRFWIVDLEPSVKDWMSWARENIHPAIVDFIRDNEKHLEHKGTIDPGKIYPSRRAWAMLNDCLTQPQKDGTVKIDHPKARGFLYLCNGFVGYEAATKFRDYLTTLDAHISAEDVCKNWKKVEARAKKLSPEKQTALIDKIEDYSKKKKLTAKEAENIGHFFQTLKPELKIVLWTKVSESREKDTHNAVALHKHVWKDIISDIYKTDIGKDLVKNNEDKDKK